MKALCQPQMLAISGTVIGARMAPTLAPELKIPVASERSLLGKYSAVALMAGAGWSVEARLHEHQVIRGVAKDTLLIYALNPAAPPES